MVTEDYKLIETKAEYVPLLVSSRGIPLAVYLPDIHAGDKALTVELYTKWYELFLVERVFVKSQIQDAYDFKVSSIHFGHLDDICPPELSAFVDHVPNPLVVRLFARRNGYRLEELADNLITGRWQEEVVNQMVMECDRCDGAGVVPLEAPYGGVIPSRCRACNGHGVLKPGA